MRRSVVIVSVLLVLAVGLVAGPAVLTSPPEEPAPETGADSEPSMVRPTDGESGFWPYLSTERTFERRSPINVVVVGETETVIRLLGESGQTEWEETDDEQAEAGSRAYALVGDNASDANENAADDELEVGATKITWSRTTGATRYAYVDPGDDEDGRWAEETAQLHDGTYYGHRYHIRMYESPNPDEPWVAMQTHSEHFDWFTLRHRVHGSQTAQARLEADLMSLPQVDVRQDVNRVYLANGNASDADGWATFVDLVGVVAAGLLIGRSTTGGILERIDRRLTETDRRRITAVRERVGLRHLGLAGTIIAIVVGVRVGGIALERTGFLSMHAIAAALYPILGVGLPVGTALLASRLERRLETAVVASTSLAVAIWLDYGLLGVNTLPIDVIVQRTLVVVALGLIAAGAARRSANDARWNALLGGGAALWLLLLGGTLSGYL